MQYKGSVETILIGIVLALSVNACQSRNSYESADYGMLYYPLSDGRLAFIPADCLITDSICPEPNLTWTSVEANQWAWLDWSPDGTRAFVVVRNKSDWIGVEKDELSLLDPQTYTLKSLIRMSNIADVSWSPDGNWLAVAGVREGINATYTDVQIASSAIFLVSPDGESIINLTDGLHGMKHHLSWLDRDTILFEVDDYPNGCGTYSLDVQNKSWARLLDPPNCYAFPQPSPDGKSVAYGSVKADVRNKLFVMNADGTKKTLLAEFDAISVLPFWSPNQEWISLDTKDDKINSLIFIISPDGTRLQNVYQSENSVFAIWAPISESYLLVRELDSKGFVSKWFGIKIPDGEVDVMSIFDEKYLPRWVSWRPPLNKVSSP